MKIGRNDPCPCGSGKKYKHCCLEKDRQAEIQARADEKRHEEEYRAKVMGQFEAAVKAEEERLGRELTDEETKAVGQKVVDSLATAPQDDLFGLSTEILDNWMPEALPEGFAHYKGLTIETPKDLTLCPMMRYLDILIDEALQAGGSLKLTAKGNLPLKVVQRCTDLAEEFAKASPNMGELTGEIFAGRNEDHFSALAFARLLALMAKILTVSDACLAVTDETARKYKEEGIGAFYLPMLEVAVLGLNWKYLDDSEAGEAMQDFWLFMVWRLSNHGNVTKMIDELFTLTPDLLKHLVKESGLEEDDEAAALHINEMITNRLVLDLLMFWGFVEADDQTVYGDKETVKALPLFAETFKFSV